MKKKIIVAIAVLGIAIGGVQVNAQNGRIMYVSDEGGTIAKLKPLQNGDVDCTACDPNGSCLVVNCK